MRSHSITELWWLQGLLGDLQEPPGRGAGSPARGGPVGAELGAEDPRGPCQPRASRGCVQDSSRGGGGCRCCSTSLLEVRATPRSHRTQQSRWQEQAGEPAPALRARIKQAAR